MIAVVTQFQMPEPITIEEARKIFLSTASNYKDFPGLIRKCYLLSEDGRTAGGFYLWKSKEESYKLYTEEWKSFVGSKYGRPPTLLYFECPVVVDNLSHEIIP